MQRLPVAKLILPLHLKLAELGSLTHTPKRSRKGGYTFCVWSSPCSTSTFSSLARFSGFMAHMGSR